jgi:hypothetical protein
MTEKDFLSKILSKHSVPQKVSLSEQLTALINVPKQPSLADQLEALKNPNPIKPAFDEKEQRKEQTKEEPKNPKYTLTNKNFSRLIDKADEHDAKIETMRLKLTDMESDQTSIQAEITKINTLLKLQENKPTIKDQTIEWKSFAYGAISLACLWFAIQRML